MRIPSKLHSYLLEPPLPHYHITRLQMLIAALISSFVPFLAFLPDYPFPAGFNVCAIASAMSHWFLFVFFNNVFPLIPFTLIVLSGLNVLLIGFVVHFTGGISSPFTFFFICILVSEALYGIDYPLATPLSILTYLAVVGAEFFGWIQPVALTARQIYKSPFITAFVAISTVVFIGFTGYAIKQIMKNLRGTITIELAKKVTFRQKLMALEAPSQIGLLVNKIVHDIRGPLCAIAGFVKTIQNENKLTAESEEDCTLMLSELDRINNLMNRMVKYIRPGQALMQFLCPVDLVETVLAVMSFYPGARRVKFEKDFSPGGLLRIYANKEELQQVIFNILKNSLEVLENQESPMIRVSISKSGLDVFITIYDNGPGISKNVLDKLTRETVSTKKEGAGVGLIIAKEIVESHQGAVSLQSREGEGTRVAIRLPLHFERPESEPNKKAAKKSTL